MHHAFYGVYITLQILKRVSCHHAAYVHCCGYAQRSAFNELHRVHCNP